MGATPIAPLMSLATPSAMPLRIRRDVPIVMPTAAIAAAFGIATARGGRHTAIAVGKTRQV